MHLDNMEQIQKRVLEDMDLSEVSKREIAVAVILAGISSTFSLPVSSNPSIGFSFLGAVEFCKRAYLSSLKPL